MPNRQSVLKRQVARERMKRRLVAARVRSNYQYRDPSKIPVKPSELDKSFTAMRQASRPEPFAQRRRDQVQRER